MAMFKSGITVVIVIYSMVMSEGMLCLLFSSSGDVFCAPFLDSHWQWHLRNREKSQHTELTGILHDCLVAWEIDFASFRTKAGNLRSNCKPLVSNTK
jgi:hypothetical protein